MLGCFSTFAQKHEAEWGDGQKRMDWWLGASVGVTHSLAENADGADFIHNYPGVDMQLGSFFSPYVGARFSFGLNPQLGRPGQAQREGDPEVYTMYRFQVLTAYVDALLDITSVLQPRRKYRPKFNVLMYLGGGMLESFDFDKKVLDWEYYPVDPWDKICWGAHAGLMISYRLSSHWDWMLEGSYNMTENRYDGVLNDKIDISGYMKLHTGLVYHFYERSSGKVRLTSEEENVWTPGYTRQDREKVLKEQRKRIEKARKQNEKRRAERNKEIEKRNQAARKAAQKQRESREAQLIESNEDAQKAGKIIEKRKNKRDKQEADAILYNIK